MPVPQEIRAAAEGSVARFCADRSSDEYRLESATRGDAITLPEREPVEA